MTKLGDASRALELADARLVAVQSRLAEYAGWDGDPETGRVIINEIVAELDFVFDDLRSAAASVAEHTCPRNI